MSDDVPRLPRGPQQDHDRAAPPRRRTQGGYDILFMGTDAEWLETLEFLWRQPRLPKKLEALETVLSYKLGRDGIKLQLDEEAKMDRLAGEWTAEVSYSVEAKPPKPWWRFW